MTNSSKNKIAITGLAIITLPFAFFGAAQAYDNFILSNLENSYKSNLEAQVSLQKATCNSHKALASFKADGMKDGEEKTRLMEIAKEDCSFQ